MDSLKENQVQVEKKAEKHGTRLFDHIMATNKKTEEEETVGIK